MRRSQPSNSMAACVPSLSVPSLSPFPLTSTTAIAVMNADCTGHHCRVYEPYYGGYHAGNNGEVGYDHRGAIETHRDPIRDFRKILPAGQTNTGSGATVIQELNFTEGAIPPLRVHLRTVARR